MGPLDAIKTGFAKSFDFKGRASRSEFWWFYLSTALVLNLIPNDQTAVLLLVYVVFLVPRHAVAVRRMRDQGRWIWEILLLSPFLVVANASFAVVYNDSLYRTEPEIFFTIALIWLALYARAFWVLSGPSQQPSVIGSQYEVPS